MLSGWNEFVKDSHEAARQAFTIWCRRGKPRTGPIYDTMKLSRTVFKYSLRYCKSQENSIKSNNMVSNLSRQDYDSFWKLVRKQQNSNVVLPSCIDGISGCNNIVKMWQEYYTDIFNSLTYFSEDIEDIQNKLNCVTDCQDINVSAKEISDAIGSLKLEKSCGKDCISAEHLKYSHMKLLDILSCLFTSMLSHGYLPKQMLVSVIVPVVKNKNSSLSSKNNYRPVALSSVISKVFEKLLLSRTESYIKTSENQFGFKQGHGTELCVLTLKEIVRYYTSQGSNIFTCYLDASMAFDKISHILLFRKLFSRNIPTYLIRILWFWYRNQYLVVKWQNKFSEEIHVNNGVRQGGIISPLVLNVGYI